jgi:hypothetical protein
LLNWTQTYPETFARQNPIPPGYENALPTKAARSIGGFLPILATGPAAPFTIGAITIGETIDRTYNEKIKQELIRSGRHRKPSTRLWPVELQAALWAVLPQYRRCSINT